MFDLFLIEEFILLWQFEQLCISLFFLDGHSDDLCFLEQYKQTISFALHACELLV